MAAAYRATRPVVEPLRQLKRLLESDDGEAADFMIEARSGGRRAHADGDRNAERARRRFQFRLGAEMPVVYRRPPVIEPQMTQDNKLVLIVDDTPTNVGVISGVLKGVSDQGRDQWREGSGARFRLREAGPHPARRDDAGHGRLRSLPAPEGQSRHPRHSGDLPHRQDRRDRRGERIRGRRRRLHPQAVLGPIVLRG